VNDAAMIPRWCWYTGMFLYAADRERLQAPKKPIELVFQDFLQEQGLSEDSGFQLRNQGLTLMMAYGLLVLPRALQQDSQPIFAFQARDKFVFEIDDDETESHGGRFLRAMRNALSHSNISITVPSNTDDPNSWVFWDEKHGSGNVRLRYQRHGRGLANSWTRSLATT